MKTRSFIYVVIAGMLWGTSGIFVKLLAPYGLTSLQMTATRAIIALISLFVYILIFDRKLFSFKIKELLLYAAAGVSLFFTASCYYSSMQMTSIATAVVLMYMSPIFVMIISVLFLGEKFTRLKLISVGLMVVGCALVSGIVGGFKFNIIGILLGFASCAAYTAYNVLTKIEMRCGCKAVSATFYTFLFMSIAALISSKPIGIVNAAVSSPWPVIPLLILLGICTSVMPYFLYTLSLRLLPVGVASALSIVEPMSATLFGLVLFDEKIGWVSGIGIALIMIAVVLLSRSPEEK